MRRGLRPVGEIGCTKIRNSLSLAAIEAELKPKVVETFDNIADAYKRLRRLQDQDIQNKLRNDSLSPVQERRYKKLKDDIIAEVKSLRLNQARIDSLIEQLYDINKRASARRARPRRRWWGRTFVSPRLPSWIRSRNCRPRLVYFLAIAATSSRPMPPGGSGRRSRARSPTRRAPSASRCI
jgi:Sigma-70, non-essential region